MSKKESNFMPVGTVRPPAPITTDNSAVIRALEQRVEELEKVAEAAVDAVPNDPDDRTVEDCMLRDALIEAGYLQEKE